jgi:hypothetical protein
MRTSLCIEIVGKWVSLSLLNLCYEKYRQV